MFSKSRIFFTVIYLIFMSVSSTSAASTSRIGLPQQYSVGAFIGGPIGASATYILSKEHSVDAAVAMEMSGDENIHAWADYLWRYPTAFTLMDYNIGWYWGAGANFRSENSANVEYAYLMGPRAVSGLIHEFNSISLEMFGEAALNQHILGASKSEFDIAVGARYYF